MNLFETSMGDRQQSGFSTSDVAWSVFWIKIFKDVWDRMKQEVIVRDSIVLSQGW